LNSNEACTGFAILIPKRGGSVKALIACSTSHAESIDALIAGAELQVRKLHKRKIYVNHNIADQVVIERLITAGFNIEGALRQPYKAGVDHLILSKKIV